MKIPEEKVKSIKKNLFDRSVDSIKDFSTFYWHNDIECINSSQALSIDFWGCIESSTSKNEIINLLFNKNESNWTMKFEYKDKHLLNEKISSQIDVFLQGFSNAIFIESKFTEKNGGSCSQLKKTKKGLIQCSGNYENQVNPDNNIENRCSLSGKGIKYWKYISELTSLSENDTYKPCPIKNGEYQWVRNICFAKAFSEKNNNINVETYLAYIDSEKCPIANKVNNDTYLGSLKGKLYDTNTFRPISYCDSINKIIDFLNGKDEDEKQVFIRLKEWIKNKILKMT